MTETRDHFDASRLSEFIDGELPEAELRADQKHLAACPRCAYAVVCAMQEKAATARAGRRFAATPEVLGRLRAGLPGRPDSSKPEKRKAVVFPFRTAGGWALAAALLLLVTLLGWRQMHPAPTLTAEILDQHLAMLSSGAVPEVISSDRHTVKPWFQGKLPFAFNLPEALPAETTLRGGNLAFLEGEPVAVLIYTVHKHEVSVFVAARSGGAIGVMRGSSVAGTASGFSVRNATTRELRMLAVSDLNARELEQLVAALVEAQANL